MWYEYKEVQNKMHPEMRNVKSIKEALETAAKLWRDKTYMIYAPTKKKYSFFETNRIANKIGNSMLNIGIKKGDRVGLFMENIPEYVLSIYGCSKIGAIEVPINWGFKAYELEYTIDTVQISSIVVQPSEERNLVLEEVAKKSKYLRKIILLEDSEVSSRLMKIPNIDVYCLDDLMKEAKDNDPDVEIQYEDPLAIMYTSGTTGLPKPAVLPQRTYILAAKGWFCAPITSEDINYNPYPLYHGNNQFYSMVGTMLFGATYVLSSRFSVSRFWDEILENKVTYFHILGGTPVILYSAFSSEDIPPHTVKYAIGPISPELWEKFEEKFRLKVINVWALTEGALVTMNHPHEGLKKVGSIGVPVFPDLGHEVKLVDDEGNEVRVGQGEAVKKDPAAMIGYWQMEEKTREIMRDGLIFTGDVLRKDEDGYFYFVGRKKLMIRRAGENISPWEVENIINMHPAIKECCVIPVPDEIRGEEVKVLIQLKEGASISPEEVIDFCAKRMTYFKVPRYIEFVDGFPKTPSERIKRAQLIEEEKKKKDHGWDREKEMPDFRKRYYGF